LREYERATARAGDKIQAQRDAICDAFKEGLDGRMSRRSLWSSSGDERLKLVNMLTTFGTSQDITVQERRIEISFPGDDASDRLLEPVGGRIADDAACRAANGAEKTLPTLLRR
jgi:hypothetical protein